MTGVDALAGYVTAADGERLVFSLVFNGFLGEGPRDLADAIGVATEPGGGGWAAWRPAG